MQTLEKILEEINQEKLKHWDSSERIETDKLIGWCFERCAEIIRKHMSGKDKDVPANDDWIPVEERLPEESGYYLVQLSKKLPNEDYSDRVVVLYDGEMKEFISYTSLIVAWCHIPERYRKK